MYVLVTADLLWLVKKGALSRPRMKHPAGEGSLGLFCLPVLENVQGYRNY